MPSGPNEANYQLAELGTPMALEARNKYFRGMLAADRQNMSIERIAHAISGEHQRLSRSTLGLEYPTMLDLQACTDIHFLINMQVHRRWCFCPKSRACTMGVERRRRCGRGRKVFSAGNFKKE